MQFGLTIGSTLRCTVVYCDVEIIEFTCMLENRNRRNNRLQPITVVGFGMNNIQWRLRDFFDRKSTFLLIDAPKDSPCSCDHFHTPIFWSKVVIYVGTWRIFWNINSKKCFGQCRKLPVVSFPHWRRFCGGRFRPSCRHAEPRA